MPKFSILIFKSQEPSFSLVLALKKKQNQSSYEREGVLHRRLVKSEFLELVSLIMHWWFCCQSFYYRFSAASLRKDFALVDFLLFLLF